MNKKYGLIIKSPEIQSYIVGAGSPVVKEVIREDGDYSAFLPPMERQNAIYMDSMACVTFSALNCLETLFKAKYGIAYNFSDRFIAKMSGTTKQGNSLDTVANTIRKSGLVLEGGWVYPNQQRTPPFTWDDYYSPIPESLINDAKLFLAKEGFEIAYEWVRVQDFAEQLKYGPIQVTVKAWYDKNKDGVYESPASATLNHAVELIKKDEIFDSYDPGVKQLEPDYDYGLYGLQYSIKKINMFETFLSLFKKQNDTKLVRNQATGEVAWFYNNSLRIPKSEKMSIEMIKQYLIRKEGVSIPPEDWEKIPRVDL